MFVIYYQLAIVVSILIVRIIKRDLVLWPCILWTIATLVNLFYPPLIAIQLTVIWGTYFVIIRFSKQKDKISELEQLIASKPAEIKNIVHKIPKNQQQLLSGVDHRAFLINAIKEANTKVSILSGWITKYAMDGELFEAIEKALSKKITINIGYGYQDSSGKHRPLESSKPAMQKLEKLANLYPEYLNFADFANHEKLLVKDSKFVVYGSLNWLSNRKFKNSERSIVLYSPELAKIEHNRIRALLIAK